MFTLRVRPGLTYNGKPLSLWTRIKVWFWLRRCERVIYKELQAQGWSKNR